jgi:hypothetical protein
MNKVILRSGLCVMFALTFLAQSKGQSCEQQLRLAQQYYREGKVDLILNLLEPCIQDPTMDRDNLIEAFRIMANTAYLLDSVSQGQVFVEKLLNKDLSFQSSDRDIYKFREGLTQIRRSPNLQIGFQVGMNFSMVKIDDVYSGLFDPDNLKNIYGLDINHLVTEINAQVGPMLSLILIKKLTSTLAIETGIGYQITRYRLYDTYHAGTLQTMVEDYQVPLLINYQFPFLLNDNVVGLQTGLNLSFLRDWRHGAMLGTDTDFSSTELRTPFSFNYAVGLYFNGKVGNLVIRPNVQYSLGMTPRSKTLSDSENASLVYNEPSFLNYNTHFNYVTFSITFLKQRF